MKQSWKLLLIFFILSCNNSTENEVSTDSASAGTANYVYPIDYSADFSVGNSKYAEQIVRIWKDFDDNQLDRSKDLFADTITLLMPGFQMTGPLDSVMNTTKAYRSTLASVKSDVDAVIPVKSNDRGEDWVLIWGTEHHVNGNKEDSIHLQETWRFNKNGKVDLLMQYSRQPASAQ